ncbi:MAG: glycosyltransferase family 4 protein [Oscillochloridaceae bacterium umkhey_bin13]
MHICFVSLDYPSQYSGGGVGNQVRLLGHKLIEQGHRVSVVALAQSNLPHHVVDGGIDVFRVQTRKFHWYTYKLPLVGRHLVLAVREIEYAWACYTIVKSIHRQHPIDLIEGTETGAVLIALFARQIRLLIRLHGEQYTFDKYTPGRGLDFNVRLRRVFQRIALRRAALLISPSKAHAQEIRAELNGRISQIEVISNALALHQVPHSSSSPDPDTVLFVGRLERLKGVLVLLEAVAEVRQSIPGIQLLLVGSNHPTLSKDVIFTTIQRLDLKDHVQILGHVPWEQLQQLYCRASLVVLPSYYETFGVAALEAMAYSLPVVATRAGALAEVVEDGVTGLLVTPGDALALATAIMMLLSDSELRQCMGKAGALRVAQLFDADKTTSQSVAVYLRAMQV